MFKLSSAIKIVDSLSMYYAQNDIEKPQSMDTANVIALASARGVSLNTQSFTKIAKLGALRMRQMLDVVAGNESPLDADNATAYCISLFSPESYTGGIRGC